MPAHAQPTTLPSEHSRDSSGEVAVSEATPAQQRIAAAKQQIATDPKKVQAYNELAIAFLRRARETADSAYLKEAEAALAEGLKLDAADFQLQKTQVALNVEPPRFRFRKGASYGSPSPDPRRRHDLWISRPSRHRTWQLFRSRDECAMDDEHAAEQHARPSGRGNTAYLVRRCAWRPRISQHGVFPDLAQRSGRSCMDRQSDCVDPNRFRSE